MRKNHVLNNLVESYLSQHPENARPKDELDDILFMFLLGIDTIIFIFTSVRYG